MTRIIPLKVTSRKVRGLELLKGAGNKQVLIDYYLPYRSFLGRYTGRK